jgi:protein-tyrosine-phosphatase
VRAAGIGPIWQKEVSFAARQAIRERYGEDLLAHHQPELLTPELIEQADLILVMERANLKTLPRKKAYLLKKFVGEDGDVKDPSPDGKDDDTLKEYGRVLTELETLLSKHLDKILNALAV